jgi:metal-responsive CopG/Arc/MetJ family transcriptional regulator
MKSEENKIRWTISIDPKLADRIDKLAEDRKEARSECIERMLLNEIDGQEQLIRTMEDPIKRALVSALSTSPKLIEILAAAVGEQLDGKEIAANIQKQAALGKQHAAQKKSQAKAKSA